MNTTPTRDMEHVGTWERNARQRGVTMVSVLLMTVSLMTLGMLAVRSSVREANQAGQLVSRERALMVAQAAVDLASSRYVPMTSAVLDTHLVGFNPQGGACSDPCGDCIPGAGAFATGLRNEVLAGGPVSCGGRPCMRQGAVAVLPDSAGAQQTWCDIPFRDLINNGDAEAQVSVWVRNNSADALGRGGSGAWADDNDGRIVVTAQARIRNTTVTVEQEVTLAGLGGIGPLMPLSADEGYGSGHHNDNSAVAVCVDDFVEGTVAP